MKAQSALVFKANRSLETAAFPGDDKARIDPAIIRTLPRERIGGALRLIPAGHGFHSVVAF